MGATSWLARTRLDATKRSRARKPARAMLAERRGVESTLAGRLLLAPRATRPRSRGVDGYDIFSNERRGGSGHKPNEPMERLGDGGTPRVDLMGIGSPPGVLAERGGEPMRSLCSLAFQKCRVFTGSAPSLPEDLHGNCALVNSLFLCLFLGEWCGVLGVKFDNALLPSISLARLIGLTRQTVSQRELPFSSHTFPLLIL